MKFKIFLTIILFIFSLFYLKSAIYFIQDNDKLMNKIKEKEKLYYQESIPAVITKNTMIPGINGKKVNLNKSYNKMKKINTFNESLLVFDEIQGEKSINENYDKVIISGNKKIKNVSIIIDISDNYLLALVNQIINSNNVYIDILTDEKENINKTNIQNIITNNYTPYTNYCLTYNLTINKECILNHKYTILGRNISSPFLSNTKEILENGIILVYHLNEKNYTELNLVIKYIKNNNYNIVTIDKLISE